MTPMPCTIRLFAEPVLEAAAALALLEDDAVEAVADARDAVDDALPVVELGELDILVDMLDAMLDSMLDGAAVPLLSAALEAQVAEAGRSVTPAGPQMPFANWRASGEYESAMLDGHHSINTHYLDHQSRKHWRHSM
jgi:hypothetical protein